MSTQYFCTYFDTNYLGKALAMIESLGARSAPGSVRLFALCADEYSRLLLSKIAPEWVTIVPLHALEERDELLRVARGNRSRVEYLWTLTPCYILYLLQNYPGLDVLSYIDADLFFYSDPKAILEELGTKSVLIHGHDFTPGLEELLCAGIYNVGLVTFRQNTEGMETLLWWAERCLEWCYNRHEDGKYGDQAYLDDWPIRFKDVHVSRNPGIGLGPWNMEKYNFSIDSSGTPCVNDRKIVFYHYHGFTFLNEVAVVPFHGKRYRYTLPLMQSVAIPYIDAHMRALCKIREHVPDFTAGYLDQKFEFNADVSLVVRAEFEAQLAASNLPQKLVKLSPSWSLFASPQLIASKQIVFSTLSSLS